MPYYPSGTRTAYARAIAAEIRALMAVERVSVRELAAGVEDRSLNYLAIRLRDEKPFTLDDLEQICDRLGENVEALVQRAYENHFERFLQEAEAAEAGEASGQSDAPRLSAVEDANTTATLAAPRRPTVAQPVTRAARAPRKKSE